MTLKDSIAKLEEIMAKVEERQKSVKKSSRPKRAEEKPVSENYAERKAEINPEIESLRSEIESLKSAPAQTEIESLGRRIAEMAGEMENVKNKISSSAPSGIDTVVIEKRISDMRSEMERKIEDVKSETKETAISKEMEERIKSSALKSDVEGMISKISEINGKINSANNIVGNLQKRVELLEGKEKADIDKIAKEVLKGGEVEEKLKMFALNADLDKLWKDMQDYRKQIDERAKAADRLADSLNKWEQRSAAVEEKARQLDERISAIPELALMDDKIKKLEKEFNTIKKHFVVAKVTQPIILE